jgi:hypothetical protein
MNPMMKTRRSKIVTSLALLFFLTLALAFPFGPLFPWSPLKFGYNHVGYARADVYVGLQNPLSNDYGLVDRMMNEAEAFHGLSYKRRVRVIECKDWRACGRSLPWMGNLHALGGVTLATGDAIYLTPKLKEKGFSIAEFLRHELSHALISQNTSMRSSFKLNEQPWFNEGLAVSFGRQSNYVKRDEFLARAKQVDLAGYLDPAKRATPWDQRFAYPTQRYFIEYLRAGFGEERFRQFLRKNIGQPEVWRVTFADVFQLQFEQAAQAYSEAIKTGQWMPAE